MALTNPRRIYTKATAGDQRGPHIVYFGGGRCLRDGGRTVRWLGDNEVDAEVLEAEEKRAAGLG